MKKSNKPLRIALTLLVVITTLSFRTSPPPCNPEALLDNCASGLDDFVFIKSFPVFAEKADDKTEYSYVLSRGVTYRIVVCEQNAQDKKMVVNLFDRNKKLIASNYLKSSKKIFPIINYACAATGVYYVEAFFEGEKKGCGLNILGFKK